MSVLWVGLMVAAAVAVLAWAGQGEGGLEDLGFGWVLVAVLLVAGVLWVT